MPDFETLVLELLRSRPELRREELRRRIDEKKETVGAGYLTDQGALYLIASELGVNLNSSPSSSDMTIKDLYIGANDVTVIARVLSVYPISTYKRKKDGKEGRYRRLVLFDKGDAVRLTLWDQQSDDVDRLGVKPDAVVRVQNGYVKQGLDGKANLNLGSRGELKIVDRAEVVAKLPPLVRVAEKLAPITQERYYVALSCLVGSPPRYSEFVRSDGSPGSMTQFEISDGVGESKCRVVVWSPSSNDFALAQGQAVILTNLKARRSTNGAFELHGDAGTAIIPAQKEPVQMRVASQAFGTDHLLLLAIAEDKRVRVLDLSVGMEAPIVGEEILVVPDRESDGKLLCVSIERRSEPAQSALPELKVLTTKMRDSKTENTRIMVDVIALSHGTVADVETRDGSTESLGELVIGDDTGEMRLVAWRDQSHRIQGIQPGERLRVIGVSPKAGRMGGWTLELSEESVIERQRGKD